MDGRSCAFSLSLPHPTLLYLNPCYLLYKNWVGEETQRQSICSVCENLGLIISGVFFSFFLKSRVYVCLSVPLCMHLLRY